MGTAVDFPGDGQMASIVTDSTPIEQPKEPRVFVTNYAGHDYEAAEKFGKPIFITRGFVNFYSLDRVKYYLAQELQNCTPDDYLLLSGSSFLAVILAVLWYEKHGKVRILNWDKKGETYREMVLTEKNITQLLESFGEDGKERPVQRTHRPQDD